MIEIVVEIVIEIEILVEIVIELGISKQAGLEAVRNAVQVLYSGKSSSARSSIWSVVVQGAHVNLCTKFSSSISLACLLVPNSSLSRHGRHQ